MQHKEIVNHLAVDPEEIVYALTAATVLSSIVNRLGEEALSLTTEDLQLAIDEIKAAIDHNLDIGDYIEMGLDAWEITRKLKENT